MKTLALYLEDISMAMTIRRNKKKTEIGYQHLLSYKWLVTILIIFLKLDLLEKLQREFTLFCFKY